MKCKSMLIGVMMVMAVAMSFEARAARDLVWLGNQESVVGYNFWDLTNANWFVKGDADKTRVCFQDGDNAYFLEDQWIEPSVCMMRDTVSRTHQFDIGALVISNDTQTFLWCGNNGYASAKEFQAASIDIYGAATVSILNNFEWVCDFNVHSGAVYTTAGSTLGADFRNELGSMHDTRKIVFNNARYTAGTTGFGGIGNGSLLTLFFTNSVFEVNKTDHYCNIPKGVFYNTDFTFKESDQESKSILFSGSEYTFDGTRPITISGKRGVVFGKGKGVRSTLNVKDITGDDKPDLFIKSPLSKIDATYTLNKVTTRCEYRNQFIKKGAGTMLLDSLYCTTCGTMTGDVQIVEGVFAITNEVQGNTIGFNPKVGVLGPICDVDHTITAKDSGTLELWSQPFGLLNNPRKFTIAVENGGALICHTVSYFGELLLHGGTFSYANGSQTTWIEYGLFSVGKKLSFANKVYDIGIRGNHQVMYLGFDDTAISDAEPIDATHPHLTNLWSVVEMAVSDVTGNAEVDASIGLDMRDMVNMCYPTYGTSPNGYTNDPWKWCRFRGGIRKTGAGTLRIYGPASYTHTTEVAAGTLTVDSSIATSSGVTVDAGAYLSGTGTVSAVTVKANGGFEVDAAKAGWLKLPSLAAEGAVKVHVVNAAATAAADSKVVCEITGKPSTLDLDNWQIKFGDGSTARGMYLDYRATTGKVTLHKPGMILIFR